MNPPSIFLRILAYTLLLSVFGAPGGLPAETPWIYDGGKFPIPPAQQHSWKLREAEETAKTSGVPRPVLDAAKTLFAVGWADPRECEYREIVLPRRNLNTLHEGRGQIATRGWVLPSAENQRYAVAWDGLVYPVISVGETASVVEDVNRMLDGEAGSHQAGDEALSPDQATVAKVVMLLRLGRVEDSRKVWSHIEAGTTSPRREDEGLFQMLATEWLRAQFERGVRAHVERRPLLALAYFESIPGTRARIEEEARKQGIELAEFNPRSGQMGPGLDLSFVGQVPQLISDAQRRLEESGTNRAEIENPEIIADKTERIALLIRELDEVEAYPMTTKSYLEFSFDPVVAALAAEGEDAVNPLIDCLANDQRLTRSVDGSWGSQKARVVGVEEPALAALQRILKSRDQLPNLDVPYVRGSPAAPKLKREDLAKAIRGYWEKYREKTLPERWYDLLTDDSASSRVWAEAAENLTIKENQPVPVYGMGAFLFPQELDESAPLRGEVLRMKTGPSISEAMAGRLREAYAAAKLSSESFFAMDAVERLAKALVAWDGKNQLVTLRWYGGELEEAVTEQMENGQTGPLDELIRTYLVRHDAGDAQAMADYAQWLQEKDAWKLSEIVRLHGAIVFAPLWLRPDHPAILGLTKELFKNPASPWVSGAEGMNPVWLAEAAHTPLVAGTEFRMLLLAQFTNEMVVGSAQTAPQGRVVYSRAFARNGYSWDIDELPGPKQDVRLCDRIGKALSEVRGVPELALHWPKGKRDEALREIAKFVRQYGDRWTPVRKDPGKDAFREVELRFPPLVRPASKEDVAAGRAIFSSDGERRLWPLPEVPMRASWISSKDDAYGNVPEPGKPQSNDREVLIWQAEETKMGNTWQRTYGVVAKNRVSAVPADEIRFIHSFSTPGADGLRLVAKFDGRKGEPGEPLQLKTGEAVPVMLRVQNTRGELRRVPVPEKALVNAEELGLKVKLRFFPGLSGAFRTFQSQKMPEWKPLEPLEPVQVEIVSTSAEVEAFATVDLLKFDLGRFFDLSRPGIYFMDAVFQSVGLFKTEHTVSGLRFEVKR